MVNKASCLGQDFWCEEAEAFGAGRSEGYCKGKKRIVYTVEILAEGAKDMIVATVKKVS